MPSGQLPFATAWPDTTVGDLLEEHRRIASITRSVLEGAGPLAQAAFEGVDCRSFGIASFLSGTGPLMGKWTEDGLISPPEDVAAVLTRHLALSRARADRIRRESDPVLEALGQRGIQPIVLKGTHTAQAYFEEPGIRPMSDVDLLVEPHEATATQQILVELGFRDQQSVGGPIRDRVTVWRHRDTPGTVESWDCEHPDNPWTVDLHTTVDIQVQRGLRTRFGRLQFERAQPFRWGESDVRAFSPALLLVHLTLHAGFRVTNVRLIRLVELVRVLRSLATDPKFDWDEFHWLAKETGATRLLVPAMELTNRLAPDSFGQEIRAPLSGQTTKLMHDAIDRVEAMGFCGWVAWDPGLKHKFVYSRGMRDWAMGWVEVLFPTGKRGRNYLRLQARRAKLILKFIASRPGRAA